MSQPTEITQFIFGQPLNELEGNRYKLQLYAHLDRCRITHAGIKGIGDARKATLQSYGIETAADISDQRVLAVPGFGPVALRNIKQWRDQQQRRFRFDPNKGVDQAAKNVVERQILTEKIDLERKLKEGLSKLTVSSHHILTRRRTLLAQAEQTAADLAQAQADLFIEPLNGIGIRIIWSGRADLINGEGLTVTSRRRCDGPQPSCDTIINAPIEIAPMATIARLPESIGEMVAEARSGR